MGFTGRFCAHRVDVALPGGHEGVLHQVQGRLQGQLRDPILPSHYSPMSLQCMRTCPCASSSNAGAPLPD